MLRITMWTAAALALLLVVLAFHVIRLRFARRVLLGDGSDPLLAAAIRGHGNLAENAPVMLILIGLLERAGAAATPLALLAGIFVAARLSHAVSFFAPADRPALPRAIGTVATNICLIAGAVWVAMRAA